MESGAAVESGRVLNLDLRPGDGGARPADGWGAWGWCSAVGEAKEAGGPAAAAAARQLLLLLQRPCCCRCCSRAAALLLLQRLLQVGSVGAARCGCAKEDSAKEMHARGLLQI